MTLLLAGCLGFSAPDDALPVPAEALMLKGDLELQRLGIDGSFVGMVGIEGSFDAEPFVGIDMGHRLGGLATPWFRGMVANADTDLDGRLTTWTSGYTTEAGAFFGLTLPVDGDVDRFGHIPLDASTGPSSVGGFYACPGRTPWGLGSADAVALAMADPTFGAAVAATPNATLVSVLWAGHHVVMGCGHPSPPFWWIAYGDLAATMEDPTELMVATIDAVDGTVTVAPEWLRLRPAQEHVLEDVTVTTPTVGGRVTSLGTVMPLASSAALALTYDVTAAPLLSAYTVVLVTPDERIPVGTRGAVGAGTIHVPLPDPRMGAYSLEITATAAQPAPASLGVRFTAMQ